MAKTKAARNLRNEVRNAIGNAEMLIQPSKTRRVAADSIGETGTQSHWSKVPRAPRLRDCRGQVVGLPVISCAARLLPPRYLNDLRPWECKILFRRVSFIAVA
jgi:hypothetical protein